MQKCAHFLCARVPSKMFVCVRERKREIYIYSVNEWQTGCSLDREQEENEPVLVTCWKGVHFDFAGKRENVLVQFSFSF